MFQRRHKRSLVQEVRELLWPSMGWRRAARFTKHRIIRLSASPESIARGLALGVATSFSPLIGTHFIQIAILGYFMRANILSGLIASFFGNPWTYPLMWWTSIKFGAWLFNLFHLPASGTVPSQMDFGMFWHIVTHEPMRILLPWMMGGTAIGILIFPVVYFISVHLVKGAKKARSQARLRKMREEVRTITQAAP